MVFSSIFFLYLFLPATLLAYFMAGPRLRNLVLLLASLPPMRPLLLPIDNLNGKPGRQSIRQVYEPWTKSRR